MPRAQRKVPYLVWRDGVAYAQWYEEQSRQTRRFSLRTRETDEAARRFAAFLVEGGAATQVANPEGLTVSQALDQYWTEHVLPNCTAARRQEYAINYLQQFFGDTPISAVDIPMSRRYAEARRTGEVGLVSKRTSNGTSGSDSTIRRELNVLVAAAHHAKRWKRIIELPSVELTKERVLGVDDEAPYFTKEEVDLLLDMAEGELRWFITLAYYSGARRGTIEELTRSQVRFAEKRVVLKPHGKKATAKRQPIIPIFPQMEPALRALYDASEGRERLFTVRDFYFLFRHHCEKLGMGDRSNPHMLRHSRATHLLQDGVPIYSVAKLLGDTIATVERVYGHHAADYLADGLMAYEVRAG